MKRDYVTNIRVIREEKEQVDEILQGLGLNFSAVINMLMKQIILTKGVPFPIVMPSEEMSVSTEAEIKETATGLSEEGNVQMETESPGSVASEVSDDKDVVSDDTNDAIEREEQPLESVAEPVEEPLFIESPTTVDIEDVVEDVSNLGTPVKEETFTDEESVTRFEALEYSSDEDENVSDDESLKSKLMEEDVRVDDFADVFDAFQSMNILKE